MALRAVAQVRDLLANLIIPARAQLLIWLAKANSDMPKAALLPRRCPESILLTFNVRQTFSRFTLTAYRKAAPLRPQLQD